MRNIISWRLFFILFTACIISSFMALPYVLSLLPVSIPVNIYLLLLATAIQSIVLFSVAIFVGLYLSKKVGFSLPILEAKLQGGKKNENFKHTIFIAIILGIFTALLIILISFLFKSLSVDFLKVEVTISVWKSILVSFYGGIAEEVLLRLFLMTLLVWIGYKIKKIRNNAPTDLIVWLAIIISAILFGFGHLPITSGITEITPIVVFRAIVLNGVGGVIFGWLYWKKGLEASIISHFTADIVLHVFVPLIVSFFAWI